MKVTDICKANSFTESEEIEDQAIRIDGKIPEEMTLDACELFYERQAYLIKWLRRVALQ
jgi:hypothetical protein